MNEKQKILKSNSEYIGKSEGSDKFRVYISAVVLNRIDDFLKGNKQVEMGGVLCGYHTENDEVFVTDFIIARHTEADLTRLTFTHKSWESINAEKESKGGDSQIIGWFHSHPGHTVFMSGYDEFIQNNFFDKPYMISYICDPVNNERGFFSAENKTVKKLNGFYLYNDEIPDDIHTEKKTKREDKMSGGKTILIYFSFGLNLIMVILFFFILTTGQRNSRSLEMLKIQTGELKDKNADLTAKLDSLQQLIILKSLNSIDYTVKKGETLKSISIKIMNDSSKYTDIMKLNNLKNEQDIKEGQKIKIPVE